MSNSKMLDRVASSLPASAREALMTASPAMQAKLLQIYRENPDRRGYRGEASCKSSLEFTRRKLRH